MPYVGQGVGPGSAEHLWVARKPANGVQHLLDLAQHIKSLQLGRHELSAVLAFDVDAAISHNLPMANPSVGVARRLHADPRGRGKLFCGGL
eukprot:3289049-Prymnesium_polylepis.1